MCDDLSHNTLISLGEGEGHSGEMPEQLAELRRTTQNAKKYCETGFNLGNSAFEVLRSNPNVEVASFDLGGEVSKRASQRLDACYDKRLSVTWGDSKKTLNAQEPLNCDVFFIDGGHDYETAKEDLANVVGRHLHANSLVIMDDVCTGAGFCEGPRKAWDEAVEAGVCTELKRFTKDTRAWAIGRCSA